jgi:hypothetical protein
MMKNAAFLVSLLVVGCVDVETEVPGDEIEVLPKLATNALTPAQLAGASIGTNPLTQSALNSYAVNANARAALSYIVGCALPVGTNVTATYTESGAQMQMTFNGEIGLAPSWRTTALTTAEQRLVSGCVLARVNATGVSVIVSLRGPSAALNVAGSEATAYPKQEGAFFGSIFQGPDFYLGACKGAATAPAARRCAQPTGTLAMVTECGFNYAGLCSDVCAAGTYFSDCLGGNGVVYDSVVTVHIK